MISEENWGFPIFSFSLFVIFVLLSFFTFVSSTTLPKVLQNAISEYKTVGHSEFIVNLYDRDNNSGLTAEHLVIKAHFRKLKVRRSVSWRDIWSRMFNSLCAGSHFIRPGQSLKGVRLGRVAFLRVLFKDKNNAIEHANKNEDRYLETLQNELRSNGLSFPDISSAYCFTAYVLVYCNNRMSEDVSQDCNDSDAEKSRKRKDTPDPDYIQPNKKPRIAPIYEVSTSAWSDDTIQRVSLHAKSNVPTEIPTPSLNVYQRLPEASTVRYINQAQSHITVGQSEAPDSQSLTLTWQLKDISSEEDTFLEALTTNDYYGDGFFSFTHLNRAFLNTNE